MPIKINCIDNDEGAWCENKNIKKSLFGFGARWCKLYPGLNGEHCMYQTKHPRPIRPPPARPPPPPKPPPNRLIREGDTADPCPKCGSSRTWKLWPFIKSDYCIQPKCENYYEMEDMI